MANCRACGHELAGPPEPLGLGAVVTCSCGPDSWHRIPRPANPWMKLRTPGQRGGQNGSSWDGLLERHQGPGHDVTVLFDGVKPGA